MRVWTVDEGCVEHFGLFGVDRVALRVGYVRVEFD